MDILLYGANIVSAAELEIPHPRMTELRFVLVPMVEIAPALRHPVMRLTMTELLAATRDTSQVRKIGA
jgi:2-amino-4-hydroxy-6-hydroxymethyldihydropteridine diphosphokinase